MDVVVVVVVVARVAEQPLAVALTLWYVQVVGWEKNTFSFY